MTKDLLPSISIIIPTLNSERVLGKCLDSIFSQDYARESVEIIVVDGGSQDNTLSIVKAFSKRKTFSVRVLSNKKKTGEAGKALGVRNSNNELMAFIDSDNVLPHNNWLKKMVVPFRDKNIIASEPIEYTYRKDDCYINRYCALMGMNDPLCFFLGNYDRYCTLTGKWTGTPVKIENLGKYLHMSLRDESIPTFGANGFLIRRKILVDLGLDDYLFDVDVLKILLRNGETVHMAKTNTGIIHLYCSDFKTFCRKQRRRVVDYYRYIGKERQEYNWNCRRRLGIALFALSCLSIFPLFWQMIIGFCRKADPCWLFHPFACWTTLWIYGLTSTAERLGFRTQQSRSNWSQ